MLTDFSKKKIKKKTVQKISIPPHCSLKWTVWRDADFFKKNNLKQTLFTLVNSARALFTKVNNVEGCCMVQQQEARRTCFYCFKREIGWDPWIVIYVFFCHQTLLHLRWSKTQTQQHRQTLSKSNKGRGELFLTWWLGLSAYKKWSIFML
jgi:hypothetical protein